jgi:EpsI family protein
MIARRDLLIGGACAVAAAAAYGLKPRRHVSLLGKAALADVVPRTFGGWVSHDVTDLVAPREENSLASRLYSQTVGRVYQHGDTGAQVMMLLAHGDTQSDSLQLHRPEVCYPFFGFAISGNRPLHLPLGGGVTIPARRLVATAPGRQESIVYWSRLGDFIPIDSSEQRVDRFKTALSGYIADGLLARFSIAGNAAEAAFATLEEFVPELVRATTPNQRKVLVGESLARAMGAGG